MTKDKFLSFYPNNPDAIICYDSVSSALSELGILNDLTLIGALATIRTEVGKAFKPIAEYADGSAYENRHDLGNYRPGDGTLYKGRGFIQITGYNNYKSYGKSLGIDLVCHPELSLGVEVSAKILARYFKDKNIPLYCGLKDWTTVRKLVNGGANGLSTFLSVVNQYLS